MEILEGIYQAKHSEQGKEMHGGAMLKFEVFWSLCIYKNKEIGLFGAGKNYYKPFFNRQFRLKGEIISCVNNTVKLFVYNNITQENIIFEGEIFEKRLRLKSYNESTPDKIWLDDEFEYLELDYEKLEKEYK